MVVGVIAAVVLAPDRIPAGVQVAEVSVGGKTVEAAASALESSLSDRSITALDGDRRWMLSYGDLGVSLDVAATLAAAREAGAGDNVEPILTIDLTQAQTGLVTLSDQVNIAAVPGDTPQIGRAMEIPVILDRLRQDLAGELADGVLELNMIEVAPPASEPVVEYTGATTTHVVESGQELALIAREYGVSMDDIVQMNAITNPDLLYVGQELTIPAAGPYVPAQAPAAPTNRGKAIVVSTSDQRIYAFENGQLVRTHLVSTGRAQTPTVLGDYAVYVKYVADDMSGPDYFLPQVPYVMYFYSGYAVHGTYWHNSFGRPMSHGCVNLPVAEAEWFFNWAEVGTPVRVV